MRNKATAENCVFLFAYDLDGRGKKAATISNKCRSAVMDRQTYINMNTTELRVLTCLTRSI